MQLARFSVALVLLLAGRLSAPAQGRLDVEKGT